MDLSACERRGVLAAVVGSKRGLDAEAAEAAAAPRAEGAAPPRSADTGDGRPAPKRHRIVQLGAPAAGLVSGGDDDRHAAGAPAPAAAGGSGRTAATADAQQQQQQQQVHDGGGGGGHGAAASMDGAASASAVGARLDPRGAAADAAATAGLLTPSPEAAAACCSRVGMNGGSPAVAAAKAAPPPATAAVAHGGAGGVGAAGTAGKAGKAGIGIGSSRPQPTGLRRAGAQAAAMGARLRGEQRKAAEGVSALAARLAEQAQERQHQHQQKQAAKGGRSGAADGAGRASSEDDEEEADSDAAVPPLALRVIGRAGLMGAAARGAGAGGAGARGSSSPRPTVALSAAAAPAAAAAEPGEDMDESCPPFVAPSEAAIQSLGGRFARAAAAAACVPAAASGAAEEPPPPQPPLVLRQAKAPAARGTGATSTAMGGNGNGDGSKRLHAPPRGHTAAANGGGSGDAVAGLATVPRGGGGGGGGGGSGGGAIRSRQPVGRRSRDWPAAAAAGSNAAAGGAVLGGAGRGGPGRGGAVGGGAVGGGAAGGAVAGSGAPGGTVRGTAVRGGKAAGGSAVGGSAAGNGGAGGSVARGRGGACDYNKYNSLKVTKSMCDKKALVLPVGTRNAPHGVFADLFKVDVGITAGAGDCGPLPDQIELVPAPWAGLSPGTVWTAKPTKALHSGNSVWECFLRRLESMHKALRLREGDRVCFQRNAAAAAGRFSYFVWVVKGKKAEGAAAAAPKGADAAAASGAVPPAAAVPAAAVAAMAAPTVAAGAAAAAAAAAAARAVPAATAARAAAGGAAAGGGVAGAQAHQRLHPQPPQQQQGQPPPPPPKQLLPLSRALDPHRLLPPDWTSLPPQQRGEWRRLGLSLHGAIAAIARDHGGAWEGNKQLSRVPEYEQVSIDEGSVQRVSDLGAGSSSTIVIDVAQASGIADKQDAMLPAAALPPLRQLRRVWDEAQQRSVVEAGERINKGRVIAVMPKYVMPAGVAEEFVECGYKEGSEEMRAKLSERALRMCAERERVRAASSILGRAWRQLATHTLSDYPALSPIAAAGTPAAGAGATGGGAAGAAAAAAAGGAGEDGGSGWQLSSLGYGGLASLVADPRVYDSTDPTSKEWQAADTAARQGANCAVVYVRIRGLPHPVLVAARDIESGERLATYKEPAWWTTQAVEFALATRSMYNLRLHGLMCD